jgi:hypothetical protein
VATSVRGAHPLVKATRDALERGDVDEYARRYLAGTRRCLDLRVSKGALRRPLQLMDPFVKAAEARGFDVHRNGTTAVVVGAERAKLYLCVAALRTYGPHRSSCFGPLP